MLESKHSESTARLFKDSHDYRILLRHILQQISSKAGFLIEERLNAILKPYLNEEKTLVKMDNVFTVTLIYLLSCQILLQTKLELPPS